MIVRDERVPAVVLQAQRDPTLRRHHAAIVFTEIYGFLTTHDPRPIKVRESCGVLQLKRGTFRDALALLEQQGWIRFTHRDSRGIRYYVRVDERGPHRAPLGLASPHA